MIYFNDNEKFVVPWLGNLWPGAVVDGRSIVDVQPAELVGYTRAHFFAGIGGWEYALELAGWPEDREVWTGSCPCQPFSVAGKRGGVNDARHLWPEFRRLIAERRPATIFGEQVASKDGREWLAGVRADMEALGYAVGAADLCAAGAGAPHIRQRLYWVANSPSLGLGQERTDTRRSGEGSISQGRPTGFRRGSATGRVANAECDAREPGWLTNQSREGAGAQSSGAYVEPGRRSGSGRLGNPNDSRLRRRSGRGLGAGECPAGPSGLGPWSDFDILQCLDGKARRIESGSFPLASGIPNRVGRIRAYGGSIVPRLAAVFIRSFLDAV